MTSRRVKVSFKQMTNKRTQTKKKVYGLSSQSKGGRSSKEQEKESMGNCCSTMIGEKRQKLNALNHAHPPGSDLQSVMGPPP
jgi:hypothetical protein